MGNDYKPHLTTSNDAPKAAPVAVEPEKNTKKAKKESKK